MIRTGQLTQEQIKSLTDNLNQQDFKSKLRCFNDHKGLRRGEVHTIVGPKGGGKSTFIRTIICEALQSDKLVYCFLSEESPDIYTYPIFRAFNKFTNKPEVTNEFMKKLHFESQLELEVELRNPIKFLTRLRSLIFDGIYDLVILDNFTTSFFGRLPIQQQGWVVEQLKEIAVEYAIPVVLVNHTAKGVDINKQLIDGDDVRGNATTINIGSYNYLIATYFRLKEPRAFVITDKARYHKAANKRVYELVFDKELEIFTYDRISSYEEILGVIKLLNAKKTTKDY